LQGIFNTGTHPFKKIGHHMGIFWDLMQENEIEEQRSKAESLEERVEQLEQDLNKTRKLLQKTLKALESHLQKDIDGDGSY
jgi:chaperonin cofactor prefoldin